MAEFPLLVDNEPVGRGTYRYTLTTTYERPPGAYCCAFSWCWNQTLPFEPVDPFTITIGREMVVRSVPPFEPCECQCHENQRYMLGSVPAFYDR